MGPAVLLTSEKQLHFVSDSLYNHGENFSKYGFLSKELIILEKMNRTIDKSSINSWLVLKIFDVAHALPLHFFPQLADFDVFYLNSKG